MAIKPTTENWALLSDNPDAVLSANVEAMGDFFATSVLSDFMTNQKRVLQQLLKKVPAFLEEGTSIMDYLKNDAPGAIL